MAGIWDFLGGAADNYLLQEQEERKARIEQMKQEALMQRQAALEKIRQEALDKRQDDKEAAALKQFKSIQQDPMTGVWLGFRGDGTVEVIQDSTPEVKQGILGKMNATAERLEYDRLKSAQDLGMKADLNAARLGLIQAQAEAARNRGEKDPNELKSKEVRDRYDSFYNRAMSDLNRADSMSAEPLDPFEKQLRADEAARAAMGNMYSPDQISQALPRGQSRRDELNSQVTGAMDQVSNWLQGKSSPAQKQSNQSQGSRPSAEELMAQADSAIQRGADPGKVQQRLQQKLKQYGY